MASLERRLSSSNAFFYFVRTCVDIKTIAKGSNRFNDELYPSASDIPSRIFIFFLDNKQFNGDRRTNPFYFRRYFVQYTKKMKPIVGKDVYIKRTSLTIQGTDLSGKEGTTLRVHVLHIFFQASFLRHLISLFASFLYVFSGYNADALPANDMSSFRRLNTVCGWSNTATGAKISLLKFNDNSFISAWDLSTSKEGATENGMDHCEKKD